MLPDGYEDECLSPHVIYGLVDPITNLLHYIGFTSNISKRLIKHHHNVRGTKNKKKWIAHLNKLGIKAKTIIFERCKTADELPEAEHYWHSCVVACGAELYNDPFYIGIGSRKGKKHTEEAKLKISIALKDKKRGPRSEETKKKLSLSNKGKKHKPFKHQKLSQSTKDKLSIINTGKKHTPEVLEKMSKSMIGKNKATNNGMYGKKALNAKLTDEQEQIIKQEYDNGNISLQKLGIKYGVSKRVIFNIIHGLHRRSNK